MRSAAVTAMIAALMLAGCGGSSPTSTQAAGSSARQDTSSSTATTATTTVTVTSSGAATTTASSGPPPCVAAGMQLLFLGQQGATNHGELGFAVRNAGSAPCSTIGYPGIQFLDSAGGALATNPVHTTRDFFGHVPLHALTIAPGQTASFRLGVTHGAESPAGCTTAHGLQVIVPNDTATMRITIPNGAYECITTTVSPMAAGMSAYP
jgi:Domain of unknown function (DUF4232)